MEENTSKKIQIKKSLKPLWLYTHTHTHKAFLENKYNIKSEKGITLIALIITVIIMLILAGVAISVLTGNEGLFEKTQVATDIYSQSVQNEAEQMESLMNEIDYYLEKFEKDTTPPGVPEIEAVYKKFHLNNCIMNRINNIEYLGKVLSPTGGSKSTFRATSDSPEIELVTDNVTGIYRIRIGISDVIEEDINTKIYYALGNDYSEENSIEYTILKNRMFAYIDLPKNNYKKLKIRMGDKAGLEYSFGTIDVFGDLNCTNTSITRIHLNSEDNVGIEKYQYSEDKTNWIDCQEENTYNSIWNKTYYYRAVDKAGNVSLPTEGVTIRADATYPTASITSSNITQTSFVINAVGTDTQSGIAKYELYIDDVLENTEETTSENVSFNVTGKNSGVTYRCKVRVYDLVGWYRDSNEINVTTN